MSKETGKTMPHPTIPVSVIIPCYGCGLTLGRALGSIEGQTVHPSEIMVIDDGNPPAEKANLIRICRESSLGERIQLIHMARQSGPGAARNAGWNRAGGEYIAFLDADDAWHPRKLEIQFQWMKSNPHTALCSHPITHIHDESKWPTADGPGRIREVSPVRQLIRNHFFTSCVMLRNDIDLRFEPDKRYSEDYQLWLEILYHGFRGVVLAPLLAFRFKAVYGQEGLSGHLWRMEKGEIDSYVKLHRGGYLPFFLLAGLVGLSLVKFMRRIVLSRVTPRLG